VEAIRRNAEIQAQLVDDLLDVSRIVSGKMRLDIVPTELVPVLQAAIESIQPAAQSKGVLLDVELSGAPQIVAADAGRLQQMVWNLLSNAVKFTAAGGTVRVAAHHQGESLEVEVTDTGAGIAPDLLPFVFERFRQGDSSITRSHGGMGLGLALVRHLAELHGGTIVAESAGAGRGATFRLRIPALSAASQPAPAPAAEAPPLTDLHVLVVEDDADSREVLTIVLQQAGAVVAAAESAEQAMALLEQRPPDVIIADIGMPREDGYEFIRRVRHMDPARGGSAAAIAITAYARAEDRQRALDAGYQLHVPKPVDPAAVVQAVAQVIKH
jgi:CheY-like chemotaxis protein